MTADMLLAGLRARDIRVSVRGDKVVIDAPDGELSPADLGEIRAAKAAILDLLAPPADPGPDSRARIYRDWLRDLHASGLVSRLLGFQAGALAASILAEPDPDVHLGATEGLVRSCMDRRWGELGVSRPETCLPVSWDVETRRWAERGPSR